MYHLTKFDAKSSLAMGKRFRAPAIAQGAGR